MPRESTISRTYKWGVLRVRATWGTTADSQIFFDRDRDEDWQPTPFTSRTISKGEALKVVNSWLARSNA